MKLNLTKPLVVFDLETTGLDLVNDRIIQLSYIKVFPDGKEERGNILINPERPIPSLISQLTGITDDDVKDKPTFKAIAHELNNKFKGCDFAGFNSNHFDIPLLAEEFIRAGIDFDFSHCRLIDVQTIFHKMERRNLAAAYKFYCGRKMEEDFEAHRADQDTEATYRVLQGELDMYNPETQPEKETDKDGNVLVDSDGKVRKQEVFNFGKYKGQSVTDVLHRDPGYYSWMLGGDFTNDTKQVLTRIRLREFNKK